jgi:hypothetical protein
MNVNPAGSFLSNGGLNLQKKDPQSVHLTLQGRCNTGSADKYQLPFKIYFWATESISSLSISCLLNKISDDCFILLFSD